MAIHDTPLRAALSALLETHRASLDRAGLSSDAFVDLLGKLAARVWRAPDEPPATLSNADIADEIGSDAERVVRLGLEIGLLARLAEDSLAFADDSARDYLTARELIRFFSGEYSDQGLVRDRAVATITRIGPPAVPLLLDALNEPDNAVNLAAAVSLRRMGPAVAPALGRVLSHGNRRMRRWATEALASQENANAALQPLLTVLANDDDELVRLGAGIALDKSENADAIEGLIAALDDESSIVRSTAESALGRFDSPQVRRALEAHRARPPASGASHPTDLPPARRDAVGLASRQLRIFLSYPREDAEQVDLVRGRVKLAGFDAWMDSERLLAGEAWEQRLSDAIKSSDFVVALISRHTRGGYQEIELDTAVAAAPSPRGDDAPFVLPCVIDESVYRDFDALYPAALGRRNAVRLTSLDEGWHTLHRSLSQAARAAGLEVPVLMRATPRIDLDHPAATRMIVEKDFFDAYRNAEGRPPTTDQKPLLGGVLVEDPATGRIWARDCFGPLPFRGTPNAYDIARRASDVTFGGYADWRLPTLEEALSLMTPLTRRGGLHISELFSDDGYALTCDGHLMFDGSVMVWIAAYAHGDCQEVPAEASVPVRLVRTAWKS